MANRSPDKDPKRNAAARWPGDEVSSRRLVLLRFPSGPGRMRTRTRSRTRSALTLRLPGRERASGAPFTCTASLQTCTFHGQGSSSAASPRVRWGASFGVPSGIVPGVEVRGCGSCQLRESLQCPRRGRGTLTPVFRSSSSLGGASFGKGHFGFAAVERVRVPAVQERRAAAVRCPARSRPLRLSQSLAAALRAARVPLPIPGGAVPRSGSSSGHWRGPGGPSGGDAAAASAPEAGDRFPRGQR